MLNAATTEANVILTSLERSVALLMMLNKAPKNTMTKPPDKPIPQMQID